MHCNGLISQDTSIGGKFTEKEEMDDTEMQGIRWQF